MNKFNKNPSIWLTVVAIIMGNTTSAQTVEDIEALWPCPQRYVDSLYADVYWPEASMLQESQWRDDELIQQSAAILADEYSGEESKIKAITSVKNQYKDNVAQGIQLLFLASINALNIERSDYLKAIISREKGQLELAMSLEDTLNNIDRVQSDNAADSTGNSKELEALNIDLEWQQRIFQQRNDQISTMCELPVDVEQRASDVAQMLRSEAQ